MERGDLQPLVEKVGTGCERDVFEWALTSGMEWFQRATYPNGYADVTISQALSSLVNREIPEREGETRGARYHLSEDLLRSIFGRRAKP